MASSTTAASAVNTDRSRARKKKKKQFQQQQLRHTSSSSSSSSSSSNPNNNWKSQAQQQIYSTRLLKALRHVGVGGRAVRDAADRALAATARGRSRWSRAILTARGLRLKCRRRTPLRRHPPPPAAGKTRRPRLRVLRLKAKNLPAVQRKARLLGRLVPGCRKESLPVILEEAEDYIPALEMQIRAMTELLNRLAGSAPPASASS